MFSNQLPLLGILRGIEARHVKPLADLAVDVGLPALEITMNTSNAPVLIEQLGLACNGKVRVGAGTVRTRAELDAALQAGAEFVVCPMLDDHIVTACVESAVPVYPGALTPTEIWHAHELGATMVKVFPAGRFGPAYFKEIKGPFEQVKLMAVGGVNADNAADYLQAGADAVAFGGSLFRADWLAAGDYSAIAAGIKTLAAAVERGCPPQP